MCNENSLGEIPIVNAQLSNSDLLQQFRDEKESDLTQLNVDSALLPTILTPEVLPPFTSMCARR